MPRISYRGLDKPAYFRELLEPLRSIPGATAPTFAHSHVIGLAWKQTISPANINVNYHLVAPGFFETLGMRILRGPRFRLAG